ncbi:MAG: hypothetical protein A2Y33_16770 [Spirochaetes bacterium GWF1_51_8]|nr:MAG: hypothetical protein A2Y33_16770 [Spirochaetes bacterium GWF1_51_8]
MVLLLVLTAGCSGVSVKKNSIYADAESFANAPLTKEQMYEDFNVLYELVKSKFIRIGIVKELFGYDILAQLQSISNRIKSITDKKDFVRLINEALVSLQELHSTINQWELGNITADQKIKQYYSAVNSIYRSWLPKYGNQIELRLPIVYFQGEYVFYKTYTNGLTVVGAGSMVKKIDGTPIDDFILTLMSTKHPYWDKFKKKYYHEKFYLSEPVYQNKSFTLEFDDHGVSKTAKFHIDQHVIEHVTHGESEPIVMYFPERNLLYIRYTDCMDFELYEKSIPQYQGKNIQKVIIDIRGNPGGYPEMTHHLLGLIIDLPLIYSISNALKWMEDTDTTPETYILWSGYTFFDYYYRKIEVNKKLPWFEKLIDVFTFFCYIYPQPNSIRYTGKIYILQDRDIYSAANNLSQIGYYSDKIVTIGEPAGYYQGTLEEPIIHYYLLPNSKIFFRMTESADLTGVTDMQSFYHDEVDVYIPYPLDYLIDRQTNSIDFYSTKYLLYHDPLMKYALGQE